MTDISMNPRLRVVPVPVEMNGKNMLLFQDPDQVVEEAIVMPIEAAMIVQYFDGAMSVREIQEDLMRKSGQLIDSMIIQELVDELDQRLMLDSPRFQAHMRKLGEEWRREPTRPAFHAGSGYPDEERELIEFLEACYSDPEGPGPLPDAPDSDDLKAIVAPHMDVRASGAVVAHAFHALVRRSEASLFVILGTGHQEPQRMFVPTDKDFETPLGVVKTDRELLDRVSRLRRDRNPMDDYLHKKEHSIEFMTLFLQHALRGKREFKILPVLVSGMSPSVISRTSPALDPAYKDFVNALKTALAERGEKTAFIVGADLAHLGPRYGDKQTYAPVRMAKEEETDRAMLEPLLTGDKEGFFNFVAKDADARKICGLPPTYAMMGMADVEKGENLKWSYWHDETTNSVVTFTSMAFY